MQEEAERLRLAQQAREREQARLQAAEVHRKSVAAAVAVQVRVVHANGYSACSPPCLALPPCESTLPSPSNGGRSSVSVVS